MVNDGWINPHPLTILKDRNKLRCKKWNYMFHFLVIKFMHLPCVGKRMTPRLSFFFHAHMCKTDFFLNIDKDETYFTFLKIETTIGKQATSAQELLFCKKIKYVNKLPAYRAGS
jgi:hypothetical protein